MSNVMELVIERDGQDKVTVPVKMRTVLKWEKRFKGRALGQLESSLKVTMLYEIAWLACGEPVSFDEFCNTTDVSAVDDTEDDEPDPTQQVQSTES